MSQIIITENDFISNTTLQIDLPPSLYTTNDVFTIGTCWLNIVFTNEVPRKILITSDCVRGTRSLSGNVIIGSYYNTNNQTHFFSESNFIQDFGDLNKTHVFRINLFREDETPIYSHELKHLACCFIMNRTLTGTNKYPLTLVGEVQNDGTDGNVTTYSCRTEIPRGVRLDKGARVAVKDVVLPSLFEIKEGGEEKSIIGDEGGGIHHISIYSDIVSFDSDIGSRLLHSFCVGIGKGHYSPKFPLYTLASRGEHMYISFEMKVHTCHDLLQYVFKGKLELNLIIKQ